MIQYKTIKNDFKMIKKVFLILLSIIFLSSGVSFADTGVRALSMGGAFVGLADDAEATFWNPAAIGLLDQTEINYTYLLQNQDEVGYDYWFSFVYPITHIHGREWGVIGLSYMNNVDQGLVNYNSVLSLDSKLTNRWYLFSYGRHLLWENLAIGANLRYATYNSDLNQTSIISGITYPAGYSDTDSYFGFDLAGYFRFSKFSLGLLLQNVNGPKINLYGTEIPYSLNIKPGLRYSPDEKTNYSVEVEDLFNSNQIRIGGERWITPYLALRLGGYNFNKKENRAITFGCGLNSAEIFAYTDIEIDYALLYWIDNPAHQDDFSHLLGFKMKF